MVTSLDPDPTRGMILTVLGPVSPDSLGPTLMHEHLLCDLSPLCPPPKSDEDRAFLHAAVTIEILGRLHRDPANYDNVRLGDIDLACKEALLYKRAGGTTLVEVTNGGIGRVPLQLASIARATGVGVIMGTGYYVAAVHPKEISARSEVEFADEIANELQRGIGNTGIRPGIIGEIGCSWPLDLRERTVLRGAAQAQRRTGVALMVHPGRDARAPEEIVEIVGEAGGDPERTIICHIDRTVFDQRTLKQLAMTGCYLEYDLFGCEVSYYSLNPAIDMPNDAQRLHWIRWLIDEGFGDKVLLSQDICNKHRLVNYGGHGYAHILENVVPQMRSRGFDEREIHNLLIENPRRILTVI